MSIIKKVREQLKEYNVEPDEKQKIESLGIEVTVCQFVMVVMSISSVAFLFIPLIVLRDIRFILLFMAISLLSAGIGVWFWIKQADICEHPEDYV